MNLIAGPVFTRELALPPRPLSVAARLADRPGLAVLWTADGSGPSFIGSDPVEISTALDPETELTPWILDAGTLAHPAATVPRWVGLLPYDAFRAQERAAWRQSTEVRTHATLSEPWWQRYDAMVVVSDRVHVVGDSAEAVDRLCARLQSSGEVPSDIRCRALSSEDNEERHRRRIEVALELIRAGEIYQVNLARRLRFEIEGHPLRVLAALGERAPGAYCCLMRTQHADVISTSPELLLETRGANLRTRPIKGTRPRGTDAAADAALRRELETDPKEHAELAMVIDVERNDLGRIAEIGSVHVSGLPRVDAMSGVFHRWAEVSARARPGLTRTELLHAVMPSGSVTGAPKVRAMEVIADLEAQPRGLYTGGIGVLDRAGGLCLSMAIRTLTVENGVGEYYVGGGIVADSDPAREVEETLWKARQVTALLAPDSR